MSLITCYTTVAMFLFLNKPNHLASKCPDVLTTVKKYICDS